MAESQKSVVRGLLAEYDSVDLLKAAATRVRDAGYKKIDAFAPFPVHGLDACLGIKPTALPWISLTCGICGCLAGLSMEIWMNAYSYEYIISGKPFISLPAFIPVSYELTILLASFGAFFGMLALNVLPRFSNPLFTNPRFDRATDDRFFLMIDSADSRFQDAGVRALLGDTNALDLSEIVEDDSPKSIPRVILTVIVVLLLVAMIPPLAAALMRVTTSESPRFHVIFDLDFQPNKKMQQTSTLFADGRVMRPPVPGTVARGQFSEDQDADFYTGIDMKKLAILDAPRAERLVARMLLQQDDEADQPSVEEPKTEEEKSEEAKKSDPQPEESKKNELENNTEAAENPEIKDESKTDKPATDDKPADSAKTDTEAKLDVASPAGTEAPASVPPAAEAQPVDNTPYLNYVPMEITEKFVVRGKGKFEIYCAVCHGVDGSGNGLVAARARSILSPTWTPPSSLHQEPLYQQPDGKLFSTITNGIRKMPGYGSQISAADRWAIVTYIRALQRSRNAKPEDVSQGSL